MKSSNEAKIVIEPLLRAAELAGLGQAVDVVVKQPVARPVRREHNISEMKISGPQIIAKRVAEVVMCANVVEHRHDAREACVDEAAVVGDVVRPVLAI